MNYAETTHHFMKHFICSIALLLVFLKATGQGIPIGHWRDHLPYHEGIGIAEIDGKIYVATSFALFYYNKLDGSIFRLSKVNGLSDIRISAIRADDNAEMLIVAYENANVDIIIDNNVFNVNDIRRRQHLTNRTINSIRFIGDRVYLSCGFGIVVLNPVRREIIDTYIIGPGGSAINVYDVLQHGEYLIAATDQGMFRANINSPNLASFQFWHKDISHPTPNAHFNRLELFGSKLIVNKAGTGHNNDTLFVLQDNTWQYLDPLTSSQVTGLSVSANRLIVCRRHHITVFDEHLSELERITNYNPGTPAPRAALFCSDNLLNIADANEGLIRRIEPGFFQRIKPGGPATQYVFAMATSDNYLWIVPGGRNPSWGSLFFTGMVYGFTDENWVNYNQWNTPGMEPLRDLLSIAVHPNNPKHLYAGAWGGGLLELNNGQVVAVYNNTNSSLQPNVFAADWFGIGGLAFDANNNLWITNSSASHLLSVKKADGIWRSFDLSPVASGIDFGGITIDRTGQKWMMVRDHGLVVFNDNGTIDNTADDRVRRLSGAVGNGNLPGTLVLSMAVDHHGELWIGTTEGVAVIRNPGNVFTGGNFDAQRLLIEFGGYTRYLLEEETVTAIAIDGANRKWFGTDRGGVFLMSADASEQIYNFNQDNSPLLSNSITSITIAENGEVFFGTSLGLIAFRAEATTPKPTATEVLVFPNPVRPEFDGVIAIKGLEFDSEIRITDIAGNIVFKTRSIGGQAIWNGRDMRGQRAASGVYLVFISDREGMETLATKILFMH